MTAAPDYLRDPGGAPEALPANLEVERALLAAVLSNNAVLEKVADFLRPEHFYDGAHGLIYEACCALVNRGAAANALTLKNRFEREECLASVGGAQYLAEIQADYVNFIEAPHYARIILDCWIRREGIRIGQELIERSRVFDDDGTGAQALEATESEIFRLSEEATGDRGGLRPFAEAAKSYIDQAEDIYQGGQGSGLRTGLYDLDAKLGGLHRSDLLILAARPAMGKTALACAIADYVAGERAIHDDVEHPQPVAFFSLEMSADQLAGRILGSHSGVSSDRVRKNRAGQQGLEKLIQSASDNRELKLFVDDTPGLNVMQIRTRARRQMRREGLSLIVVDYLQLMSAVDRRGREANRVQEVSEISRGLKAIAKELNVPVLALSQLNRAVEAREDKQPVLSDLRDGGTIEQDADVVMFLYREEYYLSRAEPQPRDGEDQEKFNKRHAIWMQRLDAARNKAEVQITKQRHGPIGTVRLHFDADQVKFGNLAEADQGDFLG